MQRDEMPRDEIDLQRVTKGKVAALLEDGRIAVTSIQGAEQGTEWLCELLENGMSSGLSLSLGDRVLVLPPIDGEPGVVLGRIGRYREAGVGQQQPKVVIAASECLSLKCGESSIDLRADGKVMIRGEDVLVRAKGTKRIRAGTVSIN
jgi:hypothetical protein